MKYLKNSLPFVLILALWQIGSNFIRPVFLPGPGKVLKSFIDLVQSGMLLDATVASFTRITVATVLSAVIAVPLALLIANSRLADELITPVTGFMRFIPVTVFYPLLILWLGIDESMKVAFLFIAVFFTLLPSLVLILKGIDRDFIDTAYTMGMSKLEIIFRVQLPYVLPSICQTLLMIYSVGWTYVVIAEVANAEVGLGHIMSIGSARGRTDMVFVGIITILLISFLFDNAGNFIVKKSFKWKFAREISD